ncbi:MAG: PEP/pyruvate-binding domain-containing protein [Blastocatellia bacterium]
MSNASQIAINTINNEQITTSSKILDWRVAALSGASICGGKGWKLGQLYRYGFQVPIGGVVTANLYQEIMLSPELKSLQLELENISPLSVSEPQIIEKLNKIQEILVNINFSEEFSLELEVFLKKNNSLNTPVAVRSSATAEDSETASFAGIHRSFLNVLGLKDIIKAIKGCYASLWTPQAIAYRRKMNLKDDQVACAVVICEMVKAKSAGVAFSCDPRTGQLNVVTINAVNGLAEALVSGQVNPEEITVLSKESNLTEISRKSPEQQVLTPEQTIKLTQLVWRVHWAIGKGDHPQDIEWAYDGKEFWLLQARPVTRLPHYTFPNIGHLPIIWSTGNIQDAVAGVPTTLTWHMVHDFVSEILYEILDAMGYPRKDGSPMLKRFNGRGYFEVTTMQWAFYDAVGMSPEDTSRGLGGHHPLIPIPEGNPLKGRVGLTRKLRQIKFLRVLLKISRQMPKDIVNLQSRIKNWKNTDVASKSNQELADLIREILVFQYEFAKKFQLANANAGAWITPIKETLTKIKPERAEALTTAVLTGSGQITTAEHGYQLYHLAKVAQQDKDALNYLKQTPIIAKDWQKLPQTSSFRQEFEKFLAEFGHRAVYEAETANPRWNEDPSYLFEQIQIILSSENITSPKNTALLVRQAAEKEILEFSFPYRPLINWFIKKARQGAALRELSKSTLVATIEPIRKICLEVGQRMVKSHFLDDPTDIFHLSGFDMEAYLTGQWNGQGAKEIATDNRNQREIWLKETTIKDFYIFDHFGNPTTLSNTNAINKPAIIEKTSNGTILNGLAVSSGKYSGIARIIMHPSEGNLLAPGEILIAPTTDPGWTPLFLRASAIVMQVGGFLSHGAIVAREYGLPAVVNIPNLLTIIKNGQHITVDGDKGQIMIKD